MAERDFQELDLLLEQLCDDRLDEAAGNRLVELLDESPSCRRRYLDMLELHAALWTTDGERTQASDTAAEFDGELWAADHPVPRAEPYIPPVVLDYSPACRQTPGLFAPGGSLFSYAAATLIMGMAILGAWMCKIAPYQNQQLAEKHKVPSIARPESAFVGRITGMDDCRWTDPRTGTYAGASVPLGRKYALSAGLLEITYATGAKVILEGPCTYEVESDASGYLSLGKLTARVDVAKPQAFNSQISKSPNFQISKFTVRTPTAVVTDLGTEFGVEVSGEGNTTSHVFRGLVELRTVGEKRLAAAPAGVKAGGSVRLRAGESARVERDGADGDPRLVSADKAGIPPKFVRELIVSPKMIDLLDVVAGGNGWGRRRECGIDATSGEVDFAFAEKARRGSGQYSVVAWSKLIDGVFVPNGGEKAVRLDSAGHAFDGFPATSNITYGSLFTRAPEISPNKTESELKHWVYRIGRCREFMPNDRGLMTFCPNVGITFDLEAVRASNPGLRPARLRATIGMGDVRPYYPTAGNLADFWVFVDGRLKLRRERLCPTDGAVDIDVEIGPEARFLTLVSTNAGESESCDWVVVGDPAIQMISTGTEKK